MFSFSHNTSTLEFLFIWILIIVQWIGAVVISTGFEHPKENFFGFLDRKIGVSLPERNRHFILPSLRSSERNQKVPNNDAHVIFTHLGWFIAVSFSTKEECLRIS